MTLLDFLLGKQESATLNLLIPPGADLSDEATAERRANMERKRAQAIATLGKNWCLYNQRSAA